MGKKPRYNKPHCNENPGITNQILGPEATFTLIQRSSQNKYKYFDIIILSHWKFPAFYLFFVSITCRLHDSEALSLSEK